MAFFDSSGWFQYPIITFPPRTQISPVSSVPSILPSLSCTLISTLATGMPIEPGLRTPRNGFFETTGLASLKP